MASVPAFEFLREPPGPGQAPPFCVLFGDEPYLQRLALDLIKRIALGEDGDEMAVSRYEGETAVPATVFDDARTLPFLSRRRIVIVDPADDFVTRARKELESYIEKPSRTGVLVLVVRSWPSNTTLYKKVDKAGLAVDCRAPKEAELPGFATQLARTRHNLKLEPTAARMLVELVGPEVGLLASELDKLASYVGKANTIAPDDVAKMVGSGRTEEIWTVIDQATTGEGAQALIQLDKLLAAGEPPIKILAAITVNLLKVYHAGQLRVAKVPPREAAAQAGLSGWGFDKMMRQHAHLGPSRTAKIPEMIVKTDLDLKGNSPLPPATILEQLIVTLSKPRQD